MNIAPLPRSLPPDTQQAREMLQTELARPEYAGTWWERLQDWLQGMLTVQSDGNGTLMTVLAIVAVLAAAALVLIVFAIRRRRRPSPAGNPSGPVLTAERAGSGEYRRSAAAHLAAGRGAPAVLEAYRAITAAGIESGIVPDASDLTAYEVATSLLVAYPSAATAISQASHAFDSVRYGGYVPALEEARQVLDLADHLAESTPQGQRPGAVSGQPALPR
ncbi:DUF4129 domain-containing protein [Gephyromycinifex aptenodytis]|uniref:DUF4129 domain-containing protein n=1 Tax=Gephyromycinifex aptenodytis TaxID=2716227 RepID=UPI00144501D0|nr:DUF4129 domain-containing protein [Gephyromycinifex aptenodytis]